MCDILILKDSLIDTEKEKIRISSQIEKLKLTMKPLQIRLQSDGFISKASPNVIEEVRKTLEEKEEQLKILESRLSDYS